MINSLVKTIKLLAQYEYDYLYHITFLSSLSGIQSSGLQAGSGQTFNKPYQRGKLFLAEEHGVSFWNNQAETWAHHESDNPIEDGKIPVTLRVKVTPELGPFILDEEGSRDSVADAFYIEDGHIPPEDLEAFNGEDWVPVEDVDIEEIRQKVLEASDVDEEDGEFFVFPNFDVLNPGIY